MLRGRIASVTLRASPELLLDMTLDLRRHILLGGRLSLKSSPRSVEGTIALLLRVGVLAVALQCSCPETLSVESFTSSTRILYSAVFTTTIIAVGTRSA